MLKRCVIVGLVIMIAIVGLHVNQKRVMAKNAQKGEEDIQKTFYELDKKYLVKDVSYVVSHPDGFSEDLSNIALVARDSKEGSKYFTLQGLKVTLDKEALTIFTEREMPKDMTFVTFKYDEKERCIIADITVEK